LASQGDAESGPTSDFFECLALNGRVELTGERKTHIESQHPADAETILGNLRVVVTDPDTVRRSIDNPSEFLLARTFQLEAGRKHIVAIIVSESEPRRLWIITAFVTRRLSGGTRWIAI
jgi:hypothetical protein